MEKLAVEGGRPVRTKAWSFSNRGTNDFGALEREYVLNVLEHGKFFRFINKDEESYTAMLEASYRERLNVDYALAVNGGTSALICALAAAGIGPGDEVIVPAYTFIATASAVVAVRAVPVIVECDDTLNMDPKAFEAAITPYTKAVIPVHMRGVMAQMNEIVDIARKHGLLVIEDAAQANGGSYFGKALGSIGDFGCFSLQYFKIITAGEGGMVVTRKREWFERMGYQHDCAYGFWGKELTAASIPGENYRMSEINGALGYAQLQRLDFIIDSQRRHKKYALEAIGSIPGLQWQRVVDPDGELAQHLTFYLETPDLAKRFSQALRAEGINNGTVYNGGFADRHIYRNWDYILEKRMASPVGTPWNCAEYKGNVEYHPDMCPVTLDYVSRAVSVPFSPFMEEQDCLDMAEAIRKVAHFLV